MTRNLIIEILVFYCKFKEGRNYKNSTKQYLIHEIIAYTYSNIYIYNVQWDSQVINLSP